MSSARNSYRPTDAAEINCFNSVGLRDPKVQDSLSKLATRLIVENALFSQLQF